jgi:hypothetical protein
MLLFWFSRRSEEKRAVAPAGLRPANAERTFTLRC